MSIIAPSLSVADMLVADCAEGLASETHTIARLRRENLRPDRDALADAVRAFWMVSGERYEKALRRLAFGDAA